LGVERAGWGQRIVQFCRWQPRTYLQVWLLTVLGCGVPGFVIWYLAGNGVDWPYMAFTWAALVTFSNGLVQSWRLSRRRQRGL
jgi:hypothetical protein